MKKIRLLLAFCALLLGWSNAWAYQTPVADGVYYLFNTGVTDGGSGFVCRGENYAQRAVIDKYGIPLKLISTGEADTYYFQFYDTDLWLSDNGFMYTDGGTDRRRAIKIVSQGNGIYKLINTNNNNAEVENWYGHPVGDGEGNRRDYLWQFLSAAEYEAVVAGYTSTEKSTIATTMGWDLSGTNFDSYLSTNYVGIDKTSLIEHATFDTGHSTSGWTITPNDNSSMSIAWGNEGGDKITPEVYEKYGTITQTVTVPSAGLYKVSVNAFVRNANYERFHSAGAVSSVSYLKANDNKVRLCDIYSNGEVTSNFPGGPNAANNNFFSQGKYLNEVYVYVTDASKQITITLGNPSATGGCWMVFNNFKLTYYSDAVSKEDATEILSQANALADADMQATVKTALTDAKNTFDGARTIANYNALSTAIDNANTSKNAYANAKAYLDEAATVLEGTNVYTTSAYNTYYATPKAAYDAKTLTNEEANALKPTSTGWHSANTIDDILLSAWTIGGEQCKDYDKALYINTWSVEGNTDGSNFLTPFFEYWVSSGSLAPNTIVATVEGLKASTTYSFTIRARVQGTAEKIANGVTMKVGNGETVDISSGAKFSTTDFYIGNFTAVGETDASGKMTMTMTVAENSNISWLSFYNAKYTEGEDLSAYIADYEFAKSTAIANRDNAAYSAITGKERTDLVNAITTYNTVDETSKSDLIAAKEALETASNTFVTAAPAYTTFAELNTTVASTLGVALPTITSSTTAADLDNEAYIVAEYTAAKTYAEDYTDKLGAWTNAPGTNSGESWDGSVKGDAEVDSYYDEYNKSDRAMTQTVTLPAGDYVLIAKGRASTNGRLTVVVGGQTVTFPHKGASGRGIATNGDATFDPEATYANSNNGRGWEYRVITFTSDGSAATTLTFNWTTASSNWCGLDDIELYCNPAALDYSALQSAYNAVEVPTLGFETGEYAPYVNAENLANIEAAKNMLANEDANNQDEINDLKNAITSMTWTANVVEVNAVYDGYFEHDYSGSAGNVQPIGWHGVGNKDNATNVRYMNDVSNNPGLAAATNSTALFAKFTAQYGTETGYTMPLKAGAYSLNFIYGGWNEIGTREIQIYNATNNATISPSSVTAPNNTAHTKSDSWRTYNGVFVVPADGDYILSFYRENTASQNQLVISDISIYSVPAQSKTITSAGYATFCSPYALDFSGIEGLTAYIVIGTESGSTLALTPVTSVAANTGVLLEGNAKEYSIPVAASGTDYSATNKLVGVIASDVLTAKAGYVLMGSPKVGFYLNNNDFTLTANTAYLPANFAEVTGGARSAYFFRGDITGVEAVEAAAEATLKDGKYLENGKVVIVKNGVKYNAAGAQVK